MEKSTETIEKVIKHALIDALNISPKINKTETLITTVWTILKSFYIDKKQYVLLEAPTGIGKSVIAYVTNHACNIIENKLNEQTNNISYLLTSSKMLQEQINGDINNFVLSDSLSVLKGTNNYDCLVDKDKPIPYVERACAGLQNKKIEETFVCSGYCPYRIARFEASESVCAVMNYSYFLNIMRLEFNPYFSIRPLTICDEAHLLPDIVSNQFSYDISSYLLNRLHKLSIELSSFSSNDKFIEFQKLITENFLFFKNKNITISNVIEYYEKIIECGKVLSTITDGLDKKLIDEINSVFGKQITNLIEDIVSHTTNAYMLEELSKRPEDIFIESEEVNFDVISNSYLYKHIVKDLSEAKLVRNNFLSKVDKCLFMSATLGNIDEFAQLIDLEEDSYVGFRLKSPFDFSKSPINLCKSGYLNYNNFNSNIDKVLSDTIRICEQHHKNDKGIIHTSTFRIAQLLEKMIIYNKGIVSNPNRYLFYTNTQEKEEAIEKIKNLEGNFVIVGPSLQEGIDLKYDQGRFNILIKVPYSGLSDYLRKKIDRFPFWYERNTIEKIVQSIGRTNRKIDDQSDVYLLDSCFEKIVFNCSNIITDRLKYFKV